MMTDTQHAELFTILVAFAISLALSIFLKPKPKVEQQKPAGLGDFSFPTAQEGRVVPVVWGTVKQEGPNVIWYGDLRPEAITERVKTGLFSSKRITRGYRYYLGIQMAICVGGASSVGSLRRIWVGDEEIWSGVLDTDDAILDLNEPEFFGGEELGQGGIVGRLRFYRGSLSQPVNNYLTAFQDINGSTPSYIGVCYVVCEHMLFGTSTSIAPWAFEVRRIPNGLSLGTPSVNGGNDANPMNVLFEILTNSEWGLGQPSSDINTANFVAAAETLRAEGNGFSMVLDREIEAQELVRLIEQQIDGVVFVNPSTGQWEVTLARGGYDPNTLTEIDESNTLSIDKYTRGSWADTSNNVLVQFNSRALDYSETYATAQDMANVRLQGNRIFTAQANYPGVKDPTLAVQIAWRYLRTLATPVVRVEATVNRVLWNHKPGDVVLFSNAKLGVSELPMRLIGIDYGELTEGRISVQLVEDIFQFDEGAFAAPGATNWVRPPQSVVEIPVAESLVFESPRAFSVRDPESPGVLDRIWVGALNQGDGAVDINLISRVGVATYSAAGNVSGFSTAGKLQSGITAAGTQGNISLTVVPDPDTLNRLVAAMAEQITTDDAGVNLQNLVKIGNEFFAFRTVGTSGGNLLLSNGYRALLDTAPQAHAADDRVWILLGNLTDRAFQPGTSPDIKLLPRSRRASLTEPEATAISIAMNNRGRRPYPPVRLTVAGSVYPTGTQSLDTGTGGAGSDTRGLTVGWTRRDFRTGNETLAVLNEDTLPSDFPAANTTEYRVAVRNDPSGTNTLLFESAWQSGASFLATRTKILRETAGVIPARLRTVIETRHVFDGVTFSSLQTTDWDFDTASALLAGNFNFGVRAQNAATAQFTATSTGTHTVTIGTAFASGDVEYRLNGGSWITVIAATLVSGTFSATAGDTIELRHTQSGGNSLETLVRLLFGATGLAYGVFTH